MFKNWKFQLVLVLLLHLFLLLQLKFTAWPEMLLWSYMMIKGFLPYKDIAIVHTPHLVTDLFIFFKLFGVGILQLKIYTWIVVIVSDIVLFWVADKIWNRKVALVSVLSFVFLQIFFDGNGLWFESLIVPFVIFTLYLLNKKEYLWSGIAWALMFLTKQTAIWFLLPIGIMILQNFDKKKKLEPFVKFAFGVLMVSLLFVLILVVFGIQSDFYNWAINFGLFVLPRSQGQIQLPEIRNLLVSAFPLAIFAPLLFIGKGSKNDRRDLSLSLVSWAVFASMGIYPRFEYFHFQPALPFIAMAIALVYTRIKKEKLIKSFMALYLIGFAYLFANYFMANWNEGTRFYEENVKSVVSYVKSNTNPGDKIFVMNWWDNIYALTDTIPATDPWIPQLEWYQEAKGIQDKELEDLSFSKPKMIIFQEYSDFGLASYKPQKLYNYLLINYEMKEKIGGIKILVPKNK